MREDGESLFGVERRPDTGQREPQLHESHGYRWLESHHHRLGPKQPGCRRYGTDEASEEGVDRCHRREIEQHAARCSMFEQLTEVFLQLQGVVVVELFLDRRDEDLAEANDRDAGH